MSEWVDECDQTCFKSNFQHGPGSPMFEEQSPVRVVNRTFTLHVSPGDYFSVSTVKVALACILSATICFSL